MSTSPDEGLFEVSDAGAAPGARAVPADQHPWSPSAIAAFDDQAAALAAVREHGQRTERAFEAKVIEGERRYNMDPEFRHRVTLLAKIVFGPTRSRAIYDAIRAVVALEEMDGGVLDLRIRQ